MQAEEQREALTGYLSEKMGQEVRIVDAKPLAGGASRDTWHITVQGDTDTQQFVIRRDLPTQMYDDALTRPQEFALMAAAYEHGVKVAKVRYLCTDHTVLGSDFFVMDYVAGISIGPKVVHAPELAHARERLTEQLARQLMLIHSLEYDRPALDFLKKPSPALSPARATVQEMITVLDTLGIANPTWEWVLQWAEHHAPTDHATTFVHGDFRIGNLLVDAAGLAAVIDWEFAHIGDPDEELGYVCMRDWRFGKGKNHFAGIGAREPFLTAYENYSGRTVNRQSVDWWEIMGNIRWGIICMAQANRHLSGEEPSVELASLGRRSAEMQLETLRLIQSYGVGV